MAKVGIGILVILMVAVVSTGETLPKGVLPAPPASSIAAKIATNRQVYAPGDEIRITVEVDKPCYLYLYDIDPAGTVTLLFPNRFQSRPRILAGKLILPGKGYRFIVKGPEGVETLVAVAAGAPIPALKVKEEKAAFRSFKLTPNAFVKKLQVTLDKSAYSTAWTQITVYQPKGTLFIDSDPKGAEIYVNGRRVGETPKAVTVPAGESTITLEKAGFLPYSTTIKLADKTAAEISTRLEKISLQPPSVAEFSAPFSGFFALDIGTDSLGGEIGIARSFGVSAAARYLDDRAIAGPEWEIGVRLHIQAVENIRVILGGGIGLRERYVVPPSGAPLPRSIIPVPETETRVFPSLTIGLELDREYEYLFGGYDLRRGLILGIGILIGGE